MKRPPIDLKIRVMKDKKAEVDISDVNIARANPNPALTFEEFAGVVFRLSSGTVKESMERNFAGFLELLKFFE